MYGSTARRAKHCRKSTRMELVYLNHCHCRTAMVITSPLHSRALLQPDCRLPRQTVHEYSWPPPSWLSCLKEWSDSMKTGTIGIMLNFPFNSSHNRQNPQHQQCAICHIWTELDLHHNFKIQRVTFAWICLSKMELEVRCVADQSLERRTRLRSNLS